MTMMAKKALNKNIILKYISLDPPKRIKILEFFFYNTILGQY
jgi:hypothetical protein